MKLSIKRDQADRLGVFGGHKGVDFALSFQLILTPQESDLVKRYKLSSMPLGTWIYQGSEVTIATVYTAVNGRTMQYPSVDEMLARERDLKKACVALKRLLEAASTFGGEEILEITTNLKLGESD